MVQVLSVHVEPPGDHERHITSVQWYNKETGQIAVSTMPIMVQFIRDGGTAYTCDGRRIEPIEVVEDGSPYIRTIPCAATADDLLTLPRF
jgi:hypothetical protein